MQQGGGDLNADGPGFLPVGLTPSAGQANALIGVHRGDQYFKALGVGLGTGQSVRVDDQKELPKIRPVAGLVEE